MTGRFTDLDREILAFERERFTSPGRKEAAVLDRFNDLLPRYYQRLAATLAKPEALAYDPTTVRRLTRLADSRRDQRTGAAR